jgi:hypothetical protein
VEALQKSPSRFFIVLTDCHTGEPVYFPARDERVFDALWEQWPAVSRKRHPQQKVRDAIASQIKLGADPDQIIQAGRAHVAERLPKGAEFVKGLVPWLNGGLWQNWAGDTQASDPVALHAERVAAFHECGVWHDAWGERPEPQSKTTGAKP